MAHDADLANADRWRSGVPFGEAWFVFGNGRSVGLYCEARDEGARVTRLTLMVADLWARLDRGELVAFGHRVSPTISDGPVPLPTHLFFDRPPSGIQTSNDLEISGWRFERVKVCDAKAITTSRGLDQETTLFKTDDRDILPAQKRSGGRPGLYEQSAVVLNKLFKSPANASLSAEKLHPAFAVEFATSYPPGEYKVAAPSVRTLRTHLNRYRQQLAETGNKVSAV